LGGLALLYLAGTAEGGSWDVSWFDPVVGYVLLPCLMVALGLAARRYATGPLRFTGPLGLVLNLGVIVALVSNEYTAGGAALFYGATMLIAGWAGQPGCEGTVISNLVLGRDDQLGCPIFAPIDELEERASKRWHPLVHVTGCLGVGALVALAVILI
jgi:hypothetical protein